MSPNDAPPAGRPWSWGLRFSKWPGVGLDLVFPPDCADCGATLETGSEGLLCGACRAALVDGRPSCPRCGCMSRLTPGGECPVCREVRYRFERVARLGSYEGALRTAVLRIKQPVGRGLAIALGDLLASRLGADLEAWNADAVVPIPMHWSRRVWRGANSPQTIATRLAARLGIPPAEHLLVRRRRTAPQASLSPRKRRANVRGAFRARPHRDLSGARLLVVDDVMTTGATVNEAAKTLIGAGAAAVAVVVLARAEGPG